MEPIRNIHQSRHGVKFPVDLRKVMNYVVAVASKAYRGVIRLVKAEKPEDQAPEGRGNKKASGKSAALWWNYDHFFINLYLKTGSVHFNVISSLVFLRLVIAVAPAASRNHPTSYDHEWKCKNDDHKKKRIMEESSLLDQESSGAFPWL